MKRGSASEDARRAFVAAMRYLPKDIQQDIKRGIDRDAEYTEQYLTDLQLMQRVYRSTK